MLPKCMRVVLSGAGFAALLCGSSPAWAQTVGNAQSFAVMGGTGVSANGGVSTITGDVGIAPAAGSFITGFPANATVVPPFSVRGNDSTAIAARASITSLNTALVSAPPSGPNSLPELGGASFGPGVYNFAAQATLSAGNLTLTTPGLYIFKVGSFLTADTTTHVLLGAGVDPCNVFWQVTSMANLNGVNFVGNVVADAGVHLGTGATLTGRALATANGDVTLAGTDIVGGCSAPGGGGGGLPPTVTKAFSPASIPVGGISTLTIRLNNSNAAAIALTAAFTDTLPSGVLVAATPNPTTTCGGAVTATSGGSTVTLATGSTIPAGSCTIAVNVTAAAAGTFVNTILAGALQTNGGNNVAPATAPLVAAVAPTVTKAFSPASITAGGVSTLTITVSNPNAATIALTAAFTDTLPSGVLVAATPNLATTCGGAVTAPSGGSTVTLATGSTIPAGSCTIAVNVTAAAAGSFVNTIPAGGLQTSGGPNVAPATTPLAVVTAVPTLPQVFVFFLALGLAGVGYLRLRRRARAE